MLDPIALIKTAGLLGIFGIIFAESGLFFGFFLPGDSLLFFAGLLSSLGYFNFWLLLIGSAVSAILGDSVGYWFGRKVGYRIFFKEESFFFSKKNIERTKNFYARHGAKTLLLARFVPIVRTFAPIFAGVGEMPYKIFLKYNIVGGLLWPALLIPAGYFLGRAVPDIDRFILPIIGGIILVSFLPVIREILKKKNS